MRMFVAAVGVWLLQAAGVDPKSLDRLVATERAFAAATAEVGVRDGFLAFFADDAVQIRPGVDGKPATVSLARPALAESDLGPVPPINRLSWAPYTGHASADGSLGWLTGAFVGRNAATNAIASNGAYFTVWKRMPDKTWRVWLDEGAVMPEVWRDAAPFRPAPEPDAGSVGRPREAIEAMEKTVASGGQPWRAALAATARLHRSGRMPIVGRDGIAAWSAEAWTSVRYSPMRSIVAGSNDLAVVVGGYAATAPEGPEHGTWVRVWKRDGGGRWRIVFETSTAAR